MLHMKKKVCMHLIVLATTITCSLMIPNLNISLLIQLQNGRYRTPETSPRVPNRCGPELTRILERIILTPPPNPFLFASHSSYALVVQIYTQSKW